MKITHQCDKCEGLFYKTQMYDDNYCITCYETIMHL